MNIDKLNAIVKQLYEQRIGVEEAVLVYVSENEDIEFITTPLGVLPKNKLLYFIGTNIVWARAAHEQLGWQRYDGIVKILHESQDGKVIILPCRRHTFLVVIAKNVSSLAPGGLAFQMDETVEKLKAALNEEEHTNTNPRNPEVLNTAPLNRKASKTIYLPTAMEGGRQQDHYVEISLPKSSTSESD